MTTNTAAEIAAIRERFERYNADWHALDYMTTGSQIAYETEQRLSDASERFPADVSALLAIVDELTARAEAAEAALRDTSALLEKHCELEPNWNGQEYDLPFAVRLRLGENSDLLAAHDANGESGGA